MINLQINDSWFDRHSAVFHSELEALKGVISPFGTALEVGIGSGTFWFLGSVLIGVLYDFSVIAVVFFPS